MAVAAPILQPGNELVLLEGSGEYFAALIAAIDAARTEVLLETYIFDFTGTGAEVAYALERAARRGVMVRLIVDGVGTPELPAFWRDRFEQARVEWVVYSPVRALGLLWPGQ